MRRLGLVIVCCCIPLAMLVACNRSIADELDSAEIPASIYVHYYNDQSVKSQPELVNVVSDLDEIKSLLLEIATGHKDNMNLQDEQLLECRILVYHLSYGAEGKETSRKYYIVLRSSEGDFMREVGHTFINEYSIDGYSRHDNKAIIKSVGNQGWYKIQLAN